MNAERRTPDAAGASEVAFRFGPGGGLFGMFHEPHGTPRGLAVTFCAPFAEEYKSAYRTFVETARALAIAGVACLRFDYYGTGESEGAFTEFTPSRAMDDIVCAAAKVREMAGVSLVVLLGLRLGGTMALGAASRAAAQSVILWQPVTSGKAFFDLTIRQQMLRRQLIRKTEQAKADEKTVAAPSYSGTKYNLSPLLDVIDLDGFPLSHVAAEEIKQLTCLKAAEAFAGPVHLLQISHTNTMSREYRPLADALSASLAFTAVRCEPFWNRIDLTDTSPVVRQTLAWLVGGKQLV